MDLELDESIALNYVSIDRYNGYMNAIAKMYKLDAWVERRVRTSGDVYAITFGPAWQADEQALKHKYVHIICKFVGDTKKGKITHFAVSTQKEAIQATASSFKLKSGIEFIEIPDKVKTIKQLWPLMLS